MPFEVGAWVQHADGEGAVAQVDDVGGRLSYRVRLFDERREVIATEAELSSLGTLPAKNVNDIVTFGGLTGTVKEVDGTRYRVEVTYPVTKNIEATNSFWVDRWRFEAR